MVAKHRKMNIIEEFIFKCINSGTPDLTNVEGITSFLKINDVFIRGRIQEFIKNKVLIEENEVLFLTDTGKDIYKKGIVPSNPKQETLMFYYEPMFHKWTLKGGDSYLPEGEELFPLYNEEKANEKAANILFDEQEIITIGNQSGAIFETESVQFVIDDIVVPYIFDYTYQRFGEFWVYDTIEDSIYCRVWDENQNIFREDIQSYLEEREAIHYRRKLQEEMQEREEYFHQIRRAFVQQQDQQKKKDEVAILRGLPIREAFMKSLKETKHKLMIMSPWISEKVVDNEMLRLFKNLADRNTVIYIGWGIAKREDLEDRRPTDALLSRLKQIRDKNGNQAVFVHWIGNHHTKEVISDHSYHMLGSFNWLSYRGDYNIRDESVYKIENLEMVNEAIQHTENLFLDLLENRKREIWTEEEVRGWMQEIIRLDTQKQRRYSLVSKVIQEVKEREELPLLHEICTLLITAKTSFPGLSDLVLYLLYVDNQSKQLHQTLRTVEELKPTLFQKISKEQQEQLQFIQYTPKSQRHSSKRKKKK
ncbi:hypothetical protein M3181_18475 [Mesobacillus maritimus]|uniref:hypothetical protein n=1 Tax=Mesobacillus maritimus TaxID=1643336 RepID=UPI00203F30B2|nr:hypothetical protein [Mesobacillus maritimus]MCM3670950.1 hypothetical protein [Mesobacillus maritimus]